MKKLVALLAAVILSTVGLVAFSVGSAQARPCPYTGCFETDTNVNAPNTVKKGTAPKVRVRVSTNGNAKPKGVLRVVVTNEAGFRDVIVVEYTGPRSVRLPALNQLGKYTVKVTYKPGPNRPFRKSAETETIRVKR
jgi:hypothetical protein